MPGLFAVNVELTWRIDGVFSGQLFKAESIQEENLSRFTKPTSWGNKFEKGKMRDPSILTYHWDLLSKLLNI